MTIFLSSRQAIGVMALVLSLVVLPFGSEVYAKVDRNQPPVITVTGAQSVPEGGVLSVTVTASDPEGDPTSIEAYALKPWMSFDGQRLTGVPGFSDAGSYPISFRGVNRNSRSWKRVTITVENVNRAPFLQAADTVTVGEGEVLSLPLIGSDIDGDEVTIHAGVLEPWMSFDGSTLRGQAPIGGSGRYGVDFTASDGDLEFDSTVSIVVTPDGGSFPAPWTDYFGSQTAPADWSSFVRSGGNQHTGLALIENPSLVEKLSDMVASLMLTHDVMVPVSGFAGRSQAGDKPIHTLLSLMTDDGPAAFRDAVRLQVQTLANLDPTGERIIYQLGNEITREVLSKDVRDWARSRGISLPGVAQDYDPEVIPFYVEYYLAPAVEAIRSASKDVFGSPDAVTIALGSVGDASVKAAQSWLSDLLEYQAAGNFAPSLGGAWVSEMVDLISVHYVSNSDVLSSIWDQWGGVGRIRALWTTEEIGVRSASSGEGAARTVRVAAKHLEWCYSRWLTPQKASVSFFAWEMTGARGGTSANEAMEVYRDFLGDARLEVFDSGVEPVIESGEEPDIYLFRSLDDPNKRVVSIVPRGGTAVLSELRIDKGSWTNPVDATVHTFSAAGHFEYAADAVQGPGFVDVSFAGREVLETGQAIVVTLSHPE